MVESPWKNKNWFVSHFNFGKEVTSQFKLPKKVVFHDVTLRDGEQEPGIVFRKDEKIQISELLSDMGVPRIEVGMPAVSSEDMEAVKAVAHMGLPAKIFAFARCMKRDVDLALHCDVDGVAMEIPSSDHLIKYAYGWSVEEAIKRSVEATKYAFDHGLYVAFFTIDSTRSELDTFWSIVHEVATKGHMDSYTLVDTFGVCLPRAVYNLVRQIKRRTPKPIEIHCHNDFGLAVANSLFAVEAGAEVVHTTVNGIGERSGGAALEEVAAALEMLYGMKTGLDFTKLRKLSKLVEKTSLVKVPPHKPIVGDNIFSTESGIIAGWWARVKKDRPLEAFPIKPELLGANPVRVALGKKSGKDSVLYKLAELNLKIPSDDKVGIILEKIKLLSEEKKRDLSDKEFVSIYESTK